MADDGRAPATARSRAICVLGMHRSGTSLVASLLAPLGVFLGAPEDLADAAAEDPAGFSEHKPLKDVNEALLGRLGGDWHRPPHPPAGWATAPELDDLRAEARRRLATHMAPHAVWGWKDPRTSLTLPFWQPMLPPVRHVICLRHPLEAAQSLAARDRLPIAGGLRLWLVYTASAIADTADAPRLLLAYDDVLADPAGAVRRLADFADRPVPDGDAAIARVVASRHRQRARTSLDDEAACPPQARELYAWLRELAASGGGFDAAASDRARDLLAGWRAAEHVEPTPWPAPPRPARLPRPLRGLVAAIRRRSPGR